MRKTVSGLCPETNSQQMITVTVERIQLGGGLPPSDKVIAYACSHAQEYGSLIISEQSWKHLGGLKNWGRRP